jgi:hypothetical protein
MTFATKSAPRNTLLPRAHHGGSCGRPDMRRCLVPIASGAFDPFRKSSGLADGRNTSD